MRQCNKLLFLLIAVLCFVTGCGSRGGQTFVVSRPPYEKLTFQTTEVQRGDLSASLTVKLTAQGYDEIVYRASNQDLTLSKVHVSVGDRVKKGDILVSFQSEEIRQTIADYEDEKRQKELLLQHYENLMALDEDLDYETDITMLREDIEVAGLYIEETANLLEAYQVVAKEDGIITKISEYLQNGVIKPGVELVNQVCGSGNYLAVVTDTEAFDIGANYPVNIDGIAYELRLTGIDDKTLNFQPVSGASLLSDDESLTLTLTKQEQKNVVYVDKNAVHTIKGDNGKEDTYCVYVMQENGYQRAVFVTPGDKIGNDMIITSGLNGGEKVVIR